MDHNKPNSNSDPGHPWSGKKVPHKDDYLIKNAHFTGKFREESERTALEELCRYRINKGLSSSVSEVLVHMVIYAHSDAHYYGPFKDFKVK